MTDARLRGEWVNSLKFDSLTDTAWRVFTDGLMWAAENGTDGFVPDRYLKRLHPDGEQVEAFGQIAAAGIWSKTNTGYMFNDWDGELGQSTAIQVETYKKSGRQRARQYRERTRSKLAKVVGFADHVDDIPTVSITRDVTRDVMSDVTSDARPNVGKGKGKGKALEGEGSYDEESETVNEQTGEITTPAFAPSGWEHVDGKTRRVRQSA